MNRKSIIRGLTIAIVATFALCFVTAEAQTVLKLSLTDQDKGARHAAAQLFGKKDEEYTKGKYKVQVFCCSQLGNDPKNIEQLALGGIDFTVSSTGSYAPHVDTLNLTMLPFLVETYDQGWKLYECRHSRADGLIFQVRGGSGFRELRLWAFYVSREFVMTWRKRAATCILCLLLAIGYYLRSESLWQTVLVPPSIRADARYYFMYAYNLYHHGVYSLDPRGLSEETQVGDILPDAVRSPGYPLYILLFMGGSPIGVFCPRFYSAR